MSNKGYNGWKNYETWCTALWLNNDHYYYVCELVDQIKEEQKEEKEQIYDLAISLKDYIEEFNPLMGEVSLYSDLLGASLSKVNWLDIAEDFLLD